MNNTIAKPIEVFKPGSWSCSSGEAIQFSEADLRQAAAVYDPALHKAPLVKGHPAVNDPAFGWCDRFEYKDGKLLAFPSQVDPAFAAQVNAGRHPRVSIRWFRPTTPGNPVPGSWYPEHVGFLGAATPGVSGLKPAAFAADPTGLVEFTMESEAIAAGLWRRLRDFMIGKFGQEEADNVLPTYAVTGLEEAATLSKADPANAVAYAAPEAAVAHLLDQVEFSARELAARDGELAQLRAERQTSARAETDNFLTRLINEGRVLPVHKENLAAFMAALPAEATVEFSASNGATAALPPGKWFRDYLATHPPLFSLAEFGRLPVEQGDAHAEVSFAAPHGKAVDQVAMAVHRKAVAFQASNPGVEYLAAVRAVEGQ